MASLGSNVLFCSATSTNTPVAVSTASSEFLMFRNNFLLPSRHAARRSEQNDPLWKQDEISSEFDTPYSPIIQYSPTQKPPHPHIRGHYAKERMIPARLDHKFLSRGGGRLSNALPRFLWDRVVFACFCICVLLLSYSLAGLGYAGHDYATCISFDDHSYTSTRALFPVIAVSTNTWKTLKAERGLGEERLGWKIDTTSPLGYLYPIEASLLTDAGEETVAILFPTSTATMDHPHEMYEPPTTSLVPRTYAADHGNNVFGGHDYGDDGRLFAHRIHNQRDGSLLVANNHDRNSERCRDLRLC